MALSGGGTPERLYQLLTQAPYVNQISWERVHLFWGDERLVPPDAPGSNYKQVADILLSQVPVPAENVHRMKGEMSPETAVADYIHQLQQTALPPRQWPRLDFALMGLGSDGHTASLFPGSIPPEEQSRPVRLATANYEGRPAQRLTLTPLIFNEARHLVFLVMGGNKAATVKAVLEGPIQPEIYPAQRIQPHNGRLTWLLDEAAAGQ